MPSSTEGRWLIWDGTDWGHTDFRLQVGVGDAAGTVGWRHVPDMEVWVERGYGYDGVNVDGEYPRTYTGALGNTPSGIMRPDGNGAKFPVYHGRYETPITDIVSPTAGTSQYGLEHGFFWLPPLAAEFTCQRVVLTWQQTHTWAPNGGITPFGYHTLPAPPVSMDYSDPALDVHKFEEEFDRGQTRIFELPGFQDLVNSYRSGGFGVVVGTSYDVPTFYGYGTPIAVRYVWSRETLSGWLK